MTCPSLKSEKVIVMRRMNCSSKLKHLPARGYTGTDIDAEARSDADADADAEADTEAAKKKRYKTQLQAVNDTGTNTDPEKPRCSADVAQIQSNTNKHGQTQCIPIF